MNAIAQSYGMACAICGSENLTCRSEIEKFPYGAGKNPATLQAKIDVFHCEDCQFEFTGPTAEEARHEAVCRHLGVMAPAEVKQVRKHYGLSRTEFASLTRLGEASIGRWESGSHIQNRAYDNYLYLLCYKDNHHRLLLRTRQEDDITARYSRMHVTASKSKFQCVKITESVTREEAAFDLRPELTTTAEAA